MINYNEHKHFKRKLKKMDYGEALRVSMKRYKISVNNLANNALKDYRTIVSYRNGEYLPEKESAVQLGIGLKKWIPMDVVLLLIENAGYNLCNSHEDVVYSMLLANIQDFETANAVIEECNQDELYKVNKVKRFKTCSI